MFAVPHPPFREIDVDWMESRNLRGICCAPSPEVALTSAAAPRNLDPSCEEFSVQFSTSSNEKRKCNGTATIRT